MAYKMISLETYDALQRKSLSLDRCPMCGNSAEIVIKIPCYGQEGAKVACSKCGFETKLYNIRSHFEVAAEPCRIYTPILEKSIMRGVREAVRNWNRRADNG